MVEKRLQGRKDSSGHQPAAGLPGRGHAEGASTGRGGHPEEGPAGLPRRRQPEQQQPADEAQAHTGLPRRGHAEEPAALPKRGPHAEDHAGLPVRGHHAEDHDGPKAGPHAEKQDGLPKRGPHAEEHDGLRRRGHHAEDDGLPRRVHAEEPAALPKRGPHAEEHDGLPRRGPHAENSTGFPRRGHAEAIPAGGHAEDAHGPRHGDGNRAGSDDPGGFALDMEACRGMFNAFDRDKSGYLDLEELTKLAEALWNSAHPNGPQLDRQSRAVVFPCPPTLWID